MQVPDRFRDIDGMFNRSRPDDDERWSRAWWVRFGPRLAAALFGVAVLVTIWNVAASSFDRNRIAAQHAITLSLERVLSGVRDIETGSRGFLLTGLESYLDPYQSSISTLSETTATAKETWRDGGGREGDLAPLLGLVDRKLEFAIKTVEARRNGIDPARDLVASGEGKRLMDAIRGEVARLQEVSTKRRVGIERTDNLRATILTAISAVLALGAVGYLAWLAWYRRRLAQRASEELVGLGDRFRTLADNIPQLTWMAAPNGQIYWYNQRWYDYTGLSPAEMDRRDGWQKAHDPELVDAISERYLAAIRSGEAWQDTFPLRRKDGEYRWFLSMAQPIRNSRGEIQRWFGTNTDISEQREQEKELEAARDVAEDANRAKSQFLANMSHELRTPLSAVIGYSEMLEEEMEELGEKHLLEDLGKIKSNARHLLSLINDVLDISKIEADKMEVFAETFAIAEMVKDVASTVGSLIEKKGNTLHVEARDELGSMHSDVVKIRQVLINLLSNAAKFTENGTITLAVHREVLDGQDDVVFTVRDTGLGMTEEQLARLFERFSQADASTTRRFGGTGLGLAITRAFTDMLGGSAAVESRPGEGSTFTITIPATLLPSDTEDGDATVVDAAGAEDDMVLVIDDDPSTRELLTRFLKKEGFTVRVAADGRSGLSLAELLKPRVILLDVTMPRMDGWEVLRSLKTDPRLAAIPVIMCTVIDEQTLGFSLGASDYLLKPIDWEKLKEVLARVEMQAPKGDVLVVDDDTDTRGRLEQLLAKQGWTASTAENGRVALEAARLRTPALVFLDLNMPEMDGFAFLREFRTVPAWAEIPVVVMTARDLTAAERAELKGGGARVYQKGRVSMQDLAGHLRSLAPASAPTRTPLARPKAAAPAPTKADA
ncbi:response regulator [uncultured Enterovirga sp.]|uniref:response regulator n=1 Tax=uncultured Enterovirga sp. TaxID=2026352 RepID=UPI0035C9C993